MRKKNPRFKEWLKRRLRSRERHNSNRKKKKRLLHRRGVGNPTVKKVDDQHKDLFKAVAPMYFSIKDNPNEVIPFFRNIINFTNKEREKVKIFIDMALVVEITADAIIYLLAVIKDLQRRGLVSHSFFGNLPRDTKAKAYIVNSGFLNHVKSNLKPTTKSSDEMQIKYNNCYAQLITKEACDFVCANRTQTKFLYVLINEMMLNTCQHAWNGVPNNWYLFAEKTEEQIRFVFLDTGIGIPKTVKRKILLDAFTTESRLVSSALNGTFRSQTGSNYRGKGLPKIKQCVENHNLEKLYIITNKAYCELVCESGIVKIVEKEQKLGIIGTIYYWEIKRSVS